MKISRKEEERQHDIKLRLSVYRMYFCPDNPRHRSLVSSGAHRECRLLKINLVARNTPLRADCQWASPGTDPSGVTCNVCTKIAAISWPATEAVSGIRPPTRRTSCGTVVTNELLSSPLDPAYCSPILILTARRYAGRWHRGNTRRTCDVASPQDCSSSKPTLSIFLLNFNF